MIWDCKRDRRSADVDGLKQEKMPQERDTARSLGRVLEKLPEKGMYEGIKIYEGGIGSCRNCDTR